ncbi:hypothetical protein FT663_01826 [Candidozyma haemuli var. vulneris]|uniref:Bul1 N-terminal domain-containing protein n=1 Tax=Candidozyma haemuli TaxID=45357 RepID=A0A2V1ANS9_9ASCO|nr:hypothetical protein CXQ85_003291 [[Candida] haemuloni]KAF3993491.1 hypothetical protein FT663_01826 [[Candida] haemuloni var. vulneris]KAF3993855.1 hypothetical protein FT662_00303 [[Candida] haemuloni var. vulneris]PVH19445.1 hypothetical protein CXQ85_003291 [[Candida] haemuloni]
MGIFNKSSRYVSSPINNSPSASAHNTSSRSSNSSSSDDGPYRLGPQPLVSPAYEDVPMWNILPSYQLYESTFSTHVEPGASEDQSNDPPMYEIASGSEPSSSEEGVHDGDYFSQPQNRAMFTRWENSVLGNTHKLKKLSTIAPQHAESLRIDIKLTSKPCQIGVAPDVIDASKLEFSQGDSIHGFVTIQNVSKQAFSYDMFSVLFEGRVSVNGDDPNKQAVFYKFLNMLDYKASWTPAYFVGAAPQTAEIDPVDGSNLMLSSDKKFVPGVIYKKFFDFTIPEALLESACEIHDLPCHCELLPSIGLDREQFLQRLRKLREKSAASPKPGKPSFGIGAAPEPGPAKVPVPTPLGRKPTPKNLRVKDFSFPDTSVSYCVEARIIGRLSLYDKVATKDKDEFIILKDSNYPVRIIPKNTGIRTIEHERGAQQYFDQFVREVKASIEIGKSLDGRSENLTRRPSVLKNKQLYTRESFEDVTARAQEDQMYEIFLPFKKKSLTAPAKVIGMLSVKTPKNEYVVRYQPPHTYRPYTKHSVTLGRSFTVPLDLSFSFVDNSGVNPKTHNPPDIRSVNVELVLCTYRSRKYPIPVEFTKNMQFQNKPSSDSLEKYVMQPFSMYLSELSNLTERHSISALNLDNQSVMDIKCLANISTKYNSFKVENVKSDVQGGWRSADDKGMKYKKKIGVSINLDGLFNKDMNRSSDDISAEAVCLVPTFQGCIVGRYYYMSLQVKLSNNDTLTVKVPLRIQY